MLMMVGANRITDSAQYTIDNCTFINNHCFFYGGIIYADIHRIL